jgi:hypothetical protein
MALICDVPMRAMRSQSMGFRARPLPPEEPPAVMSITILWFFGIMSDPPC